MSSRNKILSNIKEGLKTKSRLRDTDDSADAGIESFLQTSVTADKDSLWVQFKEELNKIAGEYYRFASLDEAGAFIRTLLSAENTSAAASDLSGAAGAVAEKLAENGIAVVTPGDLEGDERKRIFAGIHFSIVEAVCAIADIGSIVFTMDHSGTSYPHFLCGNTIALVKKENIAPNQFALLEILDREAMKNMFFVTGPSRTADIEKVLVLGAHGPGRLIVITIG